MRRRSEPGFQICFDSRGYILRAFDGTDSDAADRRRNHAPVLVATDRKKKQGFGPEFTAKYMQFQAVFANLAALDVVTCARTSVSRART